MHFIGIGFALLALISWGFGDFLIQRTSRDYGIWPSLFCITILGSIVLFPFALKDFGAIHDQIILLLFVAVITTVVAILEFKALKIGKISVVEPVMSFELPLTVLLSVFILHEKLVFNQIALIFIIFISILLLAYSKKFHTRHLFEKGAILALSATGIMAVVNVTTGLASQNVGPIATIWFVHTFIAIVCIFRFSITKSWHHLIRGVREHPVESILVAISDNVAWLSYSAAVLYIPISLAITISESYIVLSILLGVFINKERLMKRQWFGVVIAIISVILLSKIS